MNKVYDNLDALQESIKNCEKCKLCKNRTNIVFGVGNENADLMFIGEGPGADEDIQGEPFVGKAGKLLDMAFMALGIKREEVYIANIVKCRPPGNRNPEDEEAYACMDYVKNQIEIVKPKVIVLLGGVALKYLLNSSEGITKSRGIWKEYNNIKCIPTFHPAALLRDDTKKIDMYSDIKNAVLEVRT